MTLNPGEKGEPFTIAGKTYIKGVSIYAGTFKQANFAEFTDKEGLQQRKPSLHGISFWLIHRTNRVTPVKPNDVEEILRSVAV